MEIKGNNEFTHIILKYNEKEQYYEDITKSVIYINRNQTSWFVVFDNKKSYNIKLSNILVVDYPQEISIDNKNVYINGIFTKVYKIIYFYKIGYKIFLYNYKTLLVNEIVVEDSKIIIDDLTKYYYHSKNNIFNYFKSLAYYASDISKESDSIEKLVFNLYKNIDSINEDSALYSYTNQSYKKRTCDPNQLIFPFSTNSSQIKAVKMVFENNLSIISGPPGTGKTQVILNIIANCVINNKKIAVISNNNTAVENIYNKLKESNYDFILATLGNSNNVDAFFKKEDLLNLSVKQLSVSNNTFNKNSLITLENLYEEKNQLQILKSKLYSTELEFTHFKNKNSNINFFDYNINFPNYKTYLELKNHLLWNNKLNFIKKIISYLKYKIKIDSIKDSNSFIYYLDYKYYENKIYNIKEKIYSLTKTLSDNNIEEYEILLKEYSKNYFNKFLLNKYTNKEYPEFNKENYRNKYSEFIDRYPVILSTTHSLLRNCEPNFMYDYVIIDEGSQSDILTSLLTMNITKNVVIIGDVKQLSQIDNESIYDVSEKFADYYKVPQEYRYKDNSILNSVSSLKAKPNESFLREHYRCDLRIINFCNEKFYNNKLIICTNTSKDEPLEVVYTVEGNHARKNPNGSGQYNARECDEIINILENINSKNVGIITPFKAQADYILNSINKNFPFVEVDTIHKYQGRQKDVIILSTVVNDLKDSGEDFITNFVTNSQLLNVAISRAIKKIYLVVSNNVYNSSNNTIAQFIDYIKYYCNDNVKQGIVISIFDSLYKDTYEVLKRQKFIKYDSYAEELLMIEIKKLLLEYPEYSVSLHVRLDDLINNYNGLTEESLKYVKHHFTHVDFVIFDKITLKPKLCIELDGTKYHDYSKKQIEHDYIKTKVLQNNNINILRIRTNESNEINKIKSYL